MSKNPSPDSLPSRSPLAEVRYSLPELLEELKADRSAGSFAMERLDQGEIGKLFRTKTTRRAKAKK